MPRRKGDDDAPTVEQLRELRSAVKAAKQEYHDRRLLASPEEHAELSARVNETVAALRAAEEADNG
jgi:hypothetical protein